MLDSSFAIITQFVSISPRKFHVCHASTSKKHSLALCQIKSAASKVSAYHKACSVIAYWHDGVFCLCVCPSVCL